MDGRGDSPQGRVAEYRTVEYRTVEYKEVMMTDPQTPEAGRQAAPVPPMTDELRAKMAPMYSGDVYLPDDMEDFFAVQAAQRDLQLELNATPLTDRPRRAALMKAFFGAAGENLYLECPVYANWGCNTYWGAHCYANFNLTLVDDGEIFIGDHTMIGPNVTLVATGHPVRPDLRRIYAQYSLPIHISENVWIGANVTVLPGVTIGDNAVIGAGSLVTKDIPADTVAYGSPCRVVREINEHDDVYYWRDRKLGERFAR